MNAKLYGDIFLQSEKNCVLLCQYCHDHVYEMGWINEKRKELKRGFKAP